MAEVLNVSVRETRGTSRARRMRAAGAIPAVLYGHGQDTISLSVPSDEIETVVRHGSHIVNLQGAVVETALVRDVQWDAFGIDVLHVDLTRVKAGEAVELTVPIELRGDAPGVKAGGIVKHLLHEVEISCPVSVVPDKLVVNINDLELDGSIAASDLELPEGAKLMVDDETLVVQCEEAAPELEEEALPTEGAEPEVIGRKEEEGEGES